MSFMKDGFPFWYYFMRVYFIARGKKLYSFYILPVNQFGSSSGIQHRGPHLDMYLIV